LGGAAPRGRGARLAARACRVRRGSFPVAGGVDRRAAHWSGRMNTFTVDATPGLAAYMAELEARLAQAVGRREGYASTVASEALAAGGKRLRPLLCFLSSDGGGSHVLLAAGVAT